MSMTAELAESLVAAAGRAPSVHNTQPWAFRLTDEGLELWADADRQLVVADPDGRELAISCGAAVYTLKLAARHQGLDPVVVLEPEPGEPRLLARVEVRTGEPPTPDELRLFSAVYRRHTHRGRFPGGPISRALLVDLQQTAEREGAELFTVESPGRARRLADLVAAADRHQSGEQAWRDELTGWTPPPGSRRRDGVPAGAYPATPAAGDNALPGRDFGLGRGWGSGDEPGVDDAVLTVLATSADGVADWLAAGQALQAVLLTAATQWAFAAIYTQPTELPHLRTLVAQELGTSLHAQMLLRFGYAPLAVATPRRPVTELLDH
jgi:hypothetical protein